MIAAQTVGVAGALAGSAAVLFAALFAGLPAYILARRIPS